MFNLFKNKLLLIGIGLFIIIYFPLIFLLEVHNDESFWVEYAQLININWTNNHSISYDGRMYGDVKPPFQYWLSSLFINLLDNPISSNRIVTFLITLFGFIFSFLFYKKFDKSDLGSKIFIFTYCISTIFLIFNIISIAEMYVSSLGIIFLYFLYSYFEILFHKNNTNKSKYFVISILFLLFTILTKQSGYIFIFLGLIITIFFIINNKNNNKKYYYIIKYFLIVFTSYFLMNLVIGFKTLKNVGSESIHSEVFSFKGLFNISENITIWISNFDRFFDFVLFGSLNYGIFILLIIFIYIIFNFLKTKKSEKLNNLILLLMLFICSFSSVLFMMKGASFRHITMFNIFFIFFTSFILSNFYSIYKKSIFILILLSMFPIYNFFSELYLIYNNGYTKNYFQEIGDSWGNGIGMGELDKKIKKLDPGIVFYDNQWGLPGTYIKIMSENNYKNLKFFQITQDFFMQKEKYIDQVKKEGLKTYIIFDTRNEKNMKEKTRRFLIESSELCKNNEIIYKYFQGKKLENTYLIICKN